MALSTATITANLSDMLGVDFDTRRTKVWVETNVPDDTVIDTVGNAIRLGTGTATLNSDGTLSLAVWKPGTGSNPDSWQTTIHVDYPDPGTRTRKSRAFGPFTITADADLADLVEEQEVPAEYLTTVTALLDNSVEEAANSAFNASVFAEQAETARDDAVDISGISTSDGVVEALVKNTGGGGPLTSGAVKASISAQAPIVISLARFNPDPTGATDSDAAFAALLAAAQATAILDEDDAAPTIARATKAVLEIPPGRYVINDPEVLMSTAVAVTNGWVIRGAGRRVTSIEFSPSSPGALLKNNNQYRLIEIENISFFGGNSNATFLDSISQGGGAQNYTFRNVEWSGTWANVIRLAGNASANNNSEFLFEKCLVTGDFGSFLKSGDGGANQLQDNFVNFDFVSCEIQYNTGTLINLIYGGAVRFFGGSLILLGAGTLFKLDTASHYAGTCQLHVEGQRVELHTSSSKLIDSIWKSGNITFDTCLFDAAAVASSTTIATFYGSADCGPMVVWNNCRMAGKQEYKYDGNTFNAPPGRALYHRCVISQFEKPQDSIVNTAVSGTGSLGGIWQIDFEGCMGGYTYGADGNKPGYEVSANWQRRMGAEVKVHARSIKNYLGELPASDFGDAKAYTWLPFNAVVLAVWFYLPAGLSGAYPFGGWGYTVKTSEGSPTTLASITHATNGQDLGFNQRTQLAAPFVCDSDAKRKLVLTATANGAPHYSQGLCVVEYFPGS